MKAECFRANMHSYEIASAFIYKQIYSCQK